MLNFVVRKSYDAIVSKFFGKECDGGAESDIEPSQRNS
jgi:hypothetical protein